MLITLFIAVLAATLWALRSFFFDAGVPHDPSTLELATIGAITLATYAWMRRLQAIRDRTAGLANAAIERAPPVPVRYAEAAAEIEREKSLESAERVA